MWLHDRIRPVSTKEVYDYNLEFVLVSLLTANATVEEKKLSEGFQTESSDWLLM